MDELQKFESFCDPELGLLASGMHCLHCLGGVNGASVHYLEVHLCLFVQVGELVPNWLLHLFDVEQVC